LAMGSSFINSNIDWFDIKHPYSSRRDAISKLL
jgi:hypothetical protein